MTTYLKQSQSGDQSNQHTDMLYRALRDVQADIEALRALLASHVHSGVTVGAGSTGAATTSIASTALNVQP